MTSKAAFLILAKQKLDPNAEVRNRGKVVFPANSKKVKDKKDHFPINDADQARNALSRVSQYSSVPPWYAGSLEELKAAVRNAVSRNYKGINVTKSEYSWDAFILVAEESNPFLEPQKPTDGGKKKKKVKHAY
jgi:hypothetical protein